MMRRGSPRNCALGWVAAALLLAGCGAEKPRDSAAIARIGHQEIAAADFDEYLRKNAGKEAGSLPGKVMSGLLDQLVDERLLLEVAREKELFDDGIDERAAMARLADETPAPSATEVLEHYQAHKDEYVRPERVRLRHILVSDRAVADQAHRELAAGTDFDTVVRRLAIQPLSALGGEQSRNDLPSVFADAVFDLPAGGISEVIEVDLGFHIFRVEERLPAHELTFAEAEAEVREDLVAHLRREALERMLREARNRYNPVIYEKNLSFDYAGSYPLARG